MPSSPVVTRKVKFIIPGDLVHSPVILNMNKEFGVTTNIRRANLGQDRGWVILEVIGSSEQVEKSFAWVKERGIRIEEE